jgi:hypothetical protein
MASLAGAHRVWLMHMVPGASATDPRFDDADMDEQASGL